MPLPKNAQHGCAILLPVVAFATSAWKPHFEIQGAYDGPLESTRLESTVDSRLSRLEYSSTPLSTVDAIDR